MNPANQFGNLTDSGFGNMQAAQSCGNRRRLSEGSEIIHNGWELQLLGCCLFLARPILQEHDAFHSSDSRQVIKPNEIVAYAQWLRYFFSIFLVSKRYCKS